MSSSFFRSIAKFPFFFLVCIFELYERKKRTVFVSEADSQASLAVTATGEMFKVNYSCYKVQLPTD